MIQTQTRARLVLQTWTEPVWWQKYHLWLDLIKVCSNISYCGAVSSQHVLVSHVFYCLEGTRLFLFVFFRKCTSYLRSAHTARLNCIYLSWLPWRLMTSTSLFPSLSIYPLLSPSLHPTIHIPTLSPHSTSPSIHHCRLLEVWTFHVVRVHGATHLPHTGIPPLRCSSFDPPPRSPAAVNPHNHHCQTRQGLPLMVGLGKAAASRKGACGRG